MVNDFTTESADPATPRLVTVDVQDAPHQADLVRVLLETAGLSVFLDNYHASTFAALGPAIGHIRVQVPESQVDTANRLLTIHRDAQRQRYLDHVAGVTVKDDLDVCLACGEPLDETEQQCTQCGWSWHDDQDAEQDA